jgi:hypothetical protein
MPLRKRSALPVEFVAPYFPAGSSQRNHLVTTMLKLDKWIGSVLSRGLKKATNAWRLNELVAEGLARHTRGMENRLLRKSIEETLLTCTGAEEDWTAIEFEERLKAFVRLRGRAGLMRMFLSLHIFNVICFHTRLSVTRDLDELDRSSRRIVNTAKQTQHPLSRSSAEALLAEISQSIETIL